MKDENAIKNLLHDHGYKVTPARLAILEVFAKEHKPLSAEDMHKKVKNKMKKTGGQKIGAAAKSAIDLVTVYRTLTSFEKSGILKKIDLHSDAQLFELNDHHHHHLVCTDCGKVEDFELCDVDDITKKVLKNSAAFRQVSQHSLELFGLCKSCAQ